MNVVNLCSLLSLTSILSVTSISAQGPSEGDFTIRNFQFHTGERLPELRLHYTTIGRPEGQPVLLIHGTGGSAAEFLGARAAIGLYAPGQPLDTTRYFVILPDAIGHGKSSKPSDGLRTGFPRYNYNDMVEAQYRLITEHLGIKHLRLVLGNSMGGMLTWLWGEQHAEFMDIIMPLASEPAAMGGRNWMMRRMIVDAIRTDPDWHDGAYTTQPTAWHKAAVWSGIATDGGARAIYNTVPTTRLADDEIARRLAREVRADANDRLYQLEAARDYDPAVSLSTITAQVLAINSADDERNPPELGVMEKAMGILRRGRYVLLPITDDSRGHSTTDNVALWNKYLAEVLGSERHSR